MAVVRQCDYCGETKADGYGKWIRVTSLEGYWYMFDHSWAGEYCSPHCVARKFAEVAGLAVGEPMEPLPPPQEGQQTTRLVAPAWPDYDNIGMGGMLRWLRGEEK